MRVDYARQGLLKFSRLTAVLFLKRGPVIEIGVFFLRFVGILGRFESRAAQPEISKVLRLRGVIMAGYYADPPGTFGMRGGRFIRYGANVKIVPGDSPRREYQRRRRRSRAPQSETSTSMTESPMSTPARSQVSESAFRALVEAWLQSQLPALPPPPE